MALWTEVCRSSRCMRPASGISGHEHYCAFCAGKRAADQDVAKVKRQEDVMEWECVDAYTERAWVHNGWLVRIWSDAQQCWSAMSFVPDPFAKWQPNQKQEEA